MQQAQSAQASGQRERARQAWRSATKAYPTQKSPWQSLAQDYFEAADYGNAILAAQEVLQRDNDDALAHSVLAVSGLRLSTVSMLALRDRPSYSVGSRDEALGLTRAMREALGEPAASPVRAEAPVAAPALVPARTPSPAPVAAAKSVSQPAAARPTATAAAPAAAPAVTPAVNTVSGTPRNNAAARSGAGAVVPVAATPAAARPASVAARPSRPPASSPVSKAAAAAPTPKPASADPFKLLN